MSSINTGKYGSFNTLLLNEKQKELFDLNIGGNKLYDDITQCPTRNKEENAKQLLDRCLKLIEDIQISTNAKKDISIGDYVLLNDGRYRMVASVWRDEVQLSSENGHYCYLSASCASYSGGLASSIPKDFILTDEIKEGLCWSFLLGSGAHMGVNFNIDFKVWKERR